MFINILIKECQNNKETGCHCWHERSQSFSIKPDGSSEYYVARICCWCNFFDEQTTIVPANDLTHGPYEK